MRILGLRTRQTARGSAASIAADAPLKTGASDSTVPPKDEEKETGATEDENKETDAEGNPIEEKETDAEGNPVEELDEDGKPKQPAAATAAGLKGNARVKAILQAPGASAQRPLAEYLALDTDIDSAVAAGILGKVSAAAPAAAAAGAKPTFLAAMEKVANPKTPAASSGAPKAGSSEAAVTELTSTFKKFGLSR